MALFGSTKDLSVPSNVFECKKCKNILLEELDAKFCPYCGRKLDKPSEEYLKNNWTVKI